MRQNERPENLYVAELWKKGDDFYFKKNWGRVQRVNNISKKIKTKMKY